jgi:hypothetical protein
MKYFRIPLLVLPLFLLLLACQEERESMDAMSAGKTTKAGGEKQDFDSFYRTFHRDTLYQLAHIQFPLQGVSSRPSEHGAAFRWQREDWRIHREFTSSSGFSSDPIRIGEDLVVEKITNNAGSYGMERRFARLDGDEWYLIYYAALHPL